MQVAIHLGAHCTDEDRLLRSLLQNLDVLSKEGVVVPGPGRYRDVLVQVSTKLRGERASPETQDMVREAILSQGEAERVVLSHEDFLCPHTEIFAAGDLYENCNNTTKWLRNVFPNDQVEFFISIRNPATFIPAAFNHKKQQHRKFDTFLNGTNVANICWSDVVATIQETNRGCPVTVWCNEDTPLIWPEVMHAVCGIAMSVDMIGGSSILNTIMRPEGIKRMRTYLATHPPHTEAQRRRVATAFLEKFVDNDAIEEELDVPGWTVELVDQLTKFYEEDLLEIQKMPGVKLITA